MATRSFHFRGYLLGLSLLAGLGLIGCRADTSGLATLDVGEVATLLAGSSEVVLCDANNADTRSEYGVIEGARLLTSYRGYDVAAELPIDRDLSLVFYCHSAFCSAAADAGRRAVAAGYRQVFIMPDGIRGWVEAGNPVARPSAEG